MTCYLTSRYITCYITCEHDIFGAVGSEAPTISDWHRAGGTDSAAQPCRRGS
jgi:hypothetical protein